MSKYLIIGAFLFPFLLYSQSTLKGKITYQENEKEIPFENVDVYWRDHKVYTVTNKDGLFEIPYKKEYKELIISHLGYKTDTLKITSPVFINHLMTNDNELSEVVIINRKKDLHVTHAGVNFSETLNKGELLKAACCNLSESFETNPSIDVTFTDAVTGIKQIQMLGLSSPYLQFTQENIPAIKGANQLYGFGFVPGTWIESIQISKGSGSVINGFESISGQVNFELKKPQTADPFFLNIYAAENSRLELNTEFNTKINDQFSTGLFLHGNMTKTKSDHNMDGFLDTPVGKQINILNRWSYTGLENNLESQLILRYLKDSRQAGQMDFNPDLHQNTTQFWGSETNIDKFDSYFKMGKVFPDTPYKSFGFQANWSYHNQDSYYGLNDYRVKYNNLYINSIYQSILSNTFHKFKTGLSLTLDNYKEFYNEIDYSRDDKTIGTFFEYNFENDGKFSLNAGLRADYHKNWGFFITPRIHARYKPFEKTTFRASIGKGKRNANIFAENPQLFISNRQIEISQNGDNAYGLEPETAWNTGINLLQTFSLMNRSGNFTMEYYYTDFKNQVVVDFENPRKVVFYNLEGKSYASSFQVGMNYELLKGFDVRLAYKNTLQKTDYQSGLLQKPLQSRERIFVNLSYKTPLTDKNGQWHFDWTMNNVGKMRIPDTSQNPAQYQLHEYSESFIIMLAQISKNFSKNFSVYVGAENLLDKTQHQPILEPESPFGTYFDGSMVYAPIDGRMIYAGFRYSIPKKSDH